MHWSLILLLSSLLAAGQASPPQSQNPQAAPAASPHADETSLTIPAGTKVPLALKQAISTKNAHEGDAVYAETTFPVVLENRIVIPAGTYVQGKISHIRRPGRVKGRAEVLMHFTTLIYPSGYTVMRSEKTSMKGSEGSVRQDSQTGQKVGTVGSTAATGAVVGGLSAGGKGALIGAGAGGAVGTAIALLTRGNDVRLENGTSVEMVIQRPITLDPTRFHGAGR